MMYRVTFACYGCHLHGSESGSPSIARTMCPEPRPWKGIQAPDHWDQIRRDAVWEAIQKVCAHRGGSLLAAHLRSNPVHTVVEAQVPPERVMRDFKAYGSRRLNQMRLDGPNAMAVEATAGFGGHPVCRRRAG